MSIKTGITGTRIGMTKEQKEIFYSLLKGSEHIILEVHHGCCVGVDEETTEIMKEFDNITIVGHPPIKTEYRMQAMELLDKVLPARPYLIRDKDIVDTVESLLVVPATDFKPAKIRSGTWYTANYAKDQHKDVTVLWPNGIIVDV